MSAKRTNKKAAGGPSVTDSETITFSTRLTPEQRDRVVKAADQKGWTPSNLIRIAALEKSAHILNTTTPNKIDFSNLASRIATQLLTPNAEFHGPDGEPLTGDEGEEFDVRDVSAVADRIPAHDLESIRRAAQYGGAEFLNMIVEFCDGLIARDRGSLPDPVEPVPLAARGEGPEADQ